MDKRLLDYRYICGRDNYSCAICKTELSLEKLYLSLVDNKSDLGWTTNNTIVTCKEDGCLQDYETIKTIPNIPLSWRKGRLIVISGAMYAEKSTTTHSLLHKYSRVKGRFILVKPDIDTRGDGVTTHNNETFEAKVISASRPDKYLPELLDYPIVAFDEVQFYSERILYVIHQLLRKGMLVIANGLRLDANRSLFGMTHYLLGEADDIIPLKSICNICNTIDVATRTKSKTSNFKTIKIGGSESYIAVCPECDKPD